MMRLETCDIKAVLLTSLRTNGRLTCSHAHGRMESRISAPGRGAAGAARVRRGGGKFLQGHQIGPYEQGHAVPSEKVAGPGMLTWHCGCPACVSCVLVVNAGAPVWLWCVSACVRASARVCEAVHVHKCGMGAQTARAMGNAAFQEKSYEEASKHYELAIKLDSSDPEVMYVLCVHADIHTCIYTHKVC